MAMENRENSIFKIGNGLACARRFVSLVPVQPLSVTLRGRAKVNSSLDQLEVPPKPKFPSPTLKGPNPKSPSPNINGW